MFKNSEKAKEVKFVFQEWLMLLSKFKKDVDDTLDVIRKDKREIQEIKFLQRQIEIFFVQYTAIDMIQCQYVPSQQICNNVTVCDVVIFNKKRYSWSLSPFWAQNSRNSWNLLSFIGLETNHTRELEKRSVVNVIKSVLGGVITGLSFLHIWGKDRALRLGTVPTGQ